MKHDLAKEPPPRNLGGRKLTKRTIDLMMEDPNLIRRPIVVRNTRQAIFGFDAEAYDELR